jgi:serine/threonine-protein kinase
MADGPGGVTQLTESPNQQRATSSDGIRLVFYEQAPGMTWDVMQLQLDGGYKVTSLVKTPFDERNGEISPDGHWLAYETNDSGSFEVFVKLFGDVDAGRWPVSAGGGRQPLWARDSKELFYLAPSGALMRVGVGPGATWDATQPSKLLDVGRYYTGTDTQVARMYDIARDGKFLMIKPGGDPESTPAPTSLVVVQHFDEELKRLLPAK